MSLPFTDTQFFDVFGAYNSQVWPLAAVLWAATLLTVIALIRGRARPEIVSALLAVHWSWSGLVYHAVFFARINPAAWIFAALFAVQAAALLWFGVVRRRLRFEWGKTAWHAIAGAFLVLSFAYPALSVAAGHEWPRLPIFAVPCPTTLLTTGLLLTLVPPVPRWLFAIPIVWSIVGGSAAIVFGFTPDVLLFAGGVCLTAYAIRGRTRVVNK